MKEVLLPEIPDCDFCGKPALYDVPTKMGPWAYLCSDCFKKYAGRNKEIGYKIRKVDVE